jgi:hypothetical protein
LSEEEKEKEKMKSDKSLRNLWKTIRHTNIHIMGLSEGEKRERWQRAY